MRRPRILIPGGGERFGNYSAAVEAAGGRPVFSLLGEWDGLLLCGGGDIEPWRYGRRNAAAYDLEPERDALEWGLLERFAAEQKPVLGVCRGMQLINVYFGGTLVQNIEGHTCVDGMDRMHRTCILGGFLKELYGEAVVVNSAHHQCVDRVGRGLCVLQRAPDGTVEGICHCDLPIWGVQWHPERMRWGKHAAVAADGSWVLEAFLKLCR